RHREVADIPIDKHGNLVKPAVAKLVTIFKEEVALPLNIVKVLTVLKTSVLSADDFEKMIDIYPEGLRVMWKFVVDGAARQVKPCQFRSHLPDVKFFQPARKLLIGLYRIIKYDPGIH